MSAGVFEGFRDLPADHAFRDLPEEFPLFQPDLLRLVESLDDFGIVLQAQSAKEDGGEKLAFPVDPDVKDVLGVVFKLDPGPAVRDDLPQKVGLLGV